MSFIFPQFGVDDINSTRPQGGAHINGAHAASRKQDNTFRGDDLRKYKEQLTQFSDVLPNTLPVNISIIAQFS